MRKNEKGFTLVELIVVIAIVAILAAVGIVGYTQFIQKARETAAQSELDQVVNVLRTQAAAEPIKDGDTVLVEFTGGKLIFANINQEQFDEIMGKYAEGFAGTFTLDATGLKYTLNSVTVSAKSVETDGSQEEVTYTYSPVDSDVDEDEEDEGGDGEG